LNPGYFNVIAIQGLQGAAGPLARHLFTALAGVAVVAGLSGCATLPFGEQASLSSGMYRPVVAPQTALDADLRALPVPVKRTIVAVYDFPDLTGQFKDSDTIQSLSKAVTQGGAPMLIKALQDAGERNWFTVLDRASLNDLLKERQIVTEMRKVYRGEQNIDPAVLPPLQDAGIVLEGGIVGYDTNTLTGGSGANFLGIGGNTKWTQDTITVTLRAVSAKTSEVLASVTVNKVIASVAVDGNAFRYVQLDKLLQAEAGITTNEPKQIAVQGAIDKAVMSLIMEGARLQIWSFKDKAAGAALLAQYEGEKYDGGVSPNPAAPGLPITRNAASVVETQPIPVSIRRRPAPVATVQHYAAPTGGAPSAGGDAVPAPHAAPPAQGADGELLN
jgi:curli production assembly/transport component CsgG